MQANDVRRTEQAFEGCLTNTLWQIATILAGASRDVHAHCMSNHSHLLTNIAQAYDTECLTSKFHEWCVPVAEVLLLAPFATTYSLSIMINTCSSVQEEGKDVLCNAIRAICRDVAYDDTSLTCSLNIDIVISCCQLTDILQLWQLIEHFTRDIHLINKDTVRILCSFNNLFLTCAFIDNALCYFLYWFP